VTDSKKKEKTLEEELAELEPDNGVFTNPPEEKENNRGSD